jgi:hypothetical protein
MTMQKYNWDQNFPEGREPFLGLYKIGAYYEHRIIWRANTPEHDFKFLCIHGARVEHYVMDPIAWAPLPHV